ncbi:MAG: tRNA (N6-isopentenyl adenosine(37)-C2)-methylthiotransferase MiaB [Candidatus Moranbacteria bacterium]|nr:tRNA (N6-isopentenyl adenosine(37)-C2)-methylthiotransferase MiaB [Candidatus Moranbacteria bacterium]
MKKYFIKTFGCQMNYSDSERIAAFLELHKFKPGKNINEANLVIFNTCGVRQSAEDRVYGQIHNLTTWNTKHRTKKIIVLTGCLANRKDVQRRLKDKVDLFCGIKEFPEKILSVIATSPWRWKQSLDNLNDDKSTGLPRSRSLSAFDGLPRNDNYLNIEPKYNTKYSAFVPIMTGCNNFCSYCVVPYARGREISRPAKEIIKEVRVLVKKGYKEIILLGQNANSYNYRKINFSKLLKKINAISGNFWIHFLTSHPKDMSDELIKTIAKCEKVCEYVHLPIQAGDDEILRRMNRNYTARHYPGLIKKIKSAFTKYKPGVLYAITSDIIVGFPGETRKQFAKSAEIMRKVKYDMVYFGQFSPRPGTAAWKMKDNVSKKEKERREKFLNEILKITAFENNKNYLGKIFKVIIDSQKDGFYFGRTRTMKNVKFKSAQKNLVGKFVKIKIIKANIWNLEGILS